jgi:hypothetical protein
MKVSHFHEPARIGRGLLLVSVCSRLWSFVLLAVLALGLARIAFWAGYAEHHRWAELWPALARGSRYDAAVAGALATSMLLCSLPWLAFPEWWRVLLPRVVGVTCAAVLGLLALLAICEYDYYGFYHTRFDPVMFGLFEDDTRAVLGTIWHDYPVVTDSAALLAGTVVLGGFHRRLARLLAWRGYARQRWLLATVVLAQALLLVGLARGSLGRFPLIRQDLIFSADPFQNQLVLNAPLTLYDAIRTRSREIDIGNDPTVTLRRLGFTGPQQAALQMGLSGGSDDQIAQQLFATAPGNPAGARHPSVVLALLESFGADMLATDGPGNDMLGRLRPHLAHDYHFTNFITGQNGTHPELENLLLGSPITPLTRGRAGRIAFSTSAALPFRRAGYRTVLLYGGGADWRNIGAVFKTQGFDEIYDAADIRAKYPQARSTDWGVYDQYLFDFARDILDHAAAEGRPVFLFLLTTTNHPPYTLDTPRRTLPIDPATLGERGNPDRELRRHIMATYQYQADQFGAFLDGIEAGPLADQVVVAAAGDHNLRDHYHYSLPAEQPDVDRVLGFFRLPGWMRPARVDTARFAGHADLIPTLVDLALPGERYFDTGRDLFAPAPDEGSGLACFDRLYLPQGAVFGLAAPQLHRWITPYTRLAPAGEVPPPQVAAQVRRVAAGVALRDWYIRREVLAARARH